MIDVRNFITIYFNFVNKSNIKLYSRYTSPGVVFAELSNKTIRDLLKRTVFERGDGKWIDILPTITKQFKSRAHSSTKLTLIQTSLKKNKGLVYNN